MAQESFNVSGMANKIAQDKINVAFKNIQSLIDGYVPMKTKQGYHILMMNGYFYEGQKLYVGMNVLPITKVNIFGSVGTTLLKVGELNTSGELLITRTGTFTVFQPYRIDSNIRRSLEDLGLGKHEDNKKKGD